MDWMGGWEKLFWTPIAKRNVDSLYGAHSKDRDQEKIWCRRKTEWSTQSGQSDPSMSRNPSMLSVPFKSTIMLAHSHTGLLIPTSLSSVTPLFTSMHIIDLANSWEGSPDQTLLVPLFTLCPASPSTVLRSSTWQLSVCVPVHMFHGYDSALSCRLTRGSLSIHKTRIP